MRDAEPWVSCAELLDRFSFVGRGVVQENDEGTAELPQQLAQKRADFFLSDIVIEKKVVEAQLVSLGAHGNAGDNGNFIPTAVAITDEGCAAPRRPSPDHQGSQQKAAFIGKNYVGAQPRGVFFTCSHFLRFQRSMALSSRSTARPSGF